jgi:hypothetical protein
MEGRVTRTVYVPFMSDHVVVLRGALRSHGIACQLLPPPDDETLAIGLDLCRGRECLPCFLASGDVIRACRNGTIDTTNGAVLMPAYGDPADAGAQAVLAAAFPDRDIIPVPCRALIWQNGSLHCITMQLPEGLV